mgnify:CR=1 FL=1
MLDILDKTSCNLKQIKLLLEHYRNKPLTITYNLGRNKSETFIATIENIYNYLFTVKTENNITKSFTYSDIITKTIKIYYKKN